MINPVRILLGSALLLAGSTLAVPSFAETSGAHGTHDPSRMIESNNKFWVFSTGGSGKSSPDGLVWSNGVALFPNGKPSWVATVVPNDQGLWAPDVIYYNNQYYLFYSFANKAAAVGVMVSPTLDNTQSTYKWTDHGMVVSNPTTSTYGCIDPAPAVDADNNLWVSWGSGYIHGETDDSIYVTRLDNTTGLASTTDTTKPGYPLVKGHVEASYIYLHAGYYYLWWNSGGCCSGASSTYTIHVARSQKITGPYTDAKIFYASTGSVHGPGHIGVYSACGVERFTYHYYPDSGGSVLGENELTWGADGWPVVGAASTTPLKPCGQMMGSVGGSPGVGGTGAGGSAAGGMGGVNAVGGTDNPTSAGGVAGSDNTSVAGSGGASTDGVAGSAVSSMGGSGDTGLVTGASGTATASGTAGTAPASAGTPTTTAPGNSSAGCGCSLPGSSERRGLDGLLLAALGIILAGTRRAASARRASAP